MAKFTLSFAIYLGGRMEPLGSCEAAWSQVWVSSFSPAHSKDRVWCVFLEDCDSPLSSLTRAKVTWLRSGGSGIQMQVLFKFKA